DETVALFAAMNYRLKGLEPLLHAVARLCGSRAGAAAPRFRLLVVGNPDSRTYQRQAARLGIADRVCFAGHCPDMRNAYFAAACAQAARRTAAQWTFEHHYRQLLQVFTAALARKRAA